MTPAAQEEGEWRTGRGPLPPAQPNGEEILTLLADLMQSEPKRPTYFYRDGTPIIDNELLPAYMQAALLFENDNRTVGSTKTLYGERLSTVFLGLDHSFGGGPPLIFETMLFCPEQWHPVRMSTEDVERLSAYTFGKSPEPPTEEQKQRDEENDRREAHRKKYFPDDQLQLRYSTESEAMDSHETLRMQCLIPPRWRHFLLWTIGRQEAWRHYEDEDDEW